MSAEQLQIELDRGPAEYQPGEMLSGKYSLSGRTAERIKAAELSVLWRTEGKGDEDFAVHYFERLEASGASPLQMYVPRQFSTRLPQSPLSYDGVIVKIRWVVLLRVFLSRGREWTKELPLRLGSIPPATWLDDEPVEGVSAAEGADDDD